MSLGLLAPLALLGTLMIAVPVLLHLIDRKRVPRVDFPPYRLLVAAQKRLKRRRRIRDPWLLAARILVLAALVLAYARPVLTYHTRAAAGAELGGNVVFLLDNSLSMGYTTDGGTLLDHARSRALEVLDRMAGKGRAGLVVFDTRAHDPIGGVTQDLSQVRRALHDVRLSYGETDLKAALLAGVRALLSTPEGGGDLYLLSDLCTHALPPEGSFKLPEALEGHVRLVVGALDTGEIADRSVQGIRLETREGEGGAITLTARVRFQGRGSGGDVPLDLLVDGAFLSRGYVAPPAQGDVTDKVFTLPPQTETLRRGTLKLERDALPADDAYHFLLEARRNLKAIVIDGDPGYTLSGAESFYVERALNPSKSSGSRITPVVVAVDEFRHVSLDDIAVVFMLNVPDPSPFANRLRRFVARGGGLFIALGDRVRRDTYNSALSSLLPASLGEVKVATPDLTGERPPALTYPELTHPIFQVFREAGAPVFATTEFFQFVPTAPFLKPDAAVLLKYTNGLPALLERRVGKGRVLLFTSTLDRGWTNFPLKSVFLPFVQEAAHYLAHNPAGDQVPRSFVAGHPVVLEVSSASSRLTVVDPDGRSFPLQVSGRGRGKATAGTVRLVFDEARVPGHYRVFEEAAGRDELVERPDLGFVVNVPPRETDLTRADVSQLEARLSGLPVILEGLADTRTDVEVERHLPFTYGLLWATLAMLALEGVFSIVKPSRRTRPTRTPGGRESREQDGRAAPA